MEPMNESEKLLDISSILTPRPQRLFIPNQPSPYSQSILSLSPLTGRFNSPAPFFPQQNQYTHSPDAVWSSLNLMSPLMPDSAMPFRRVVQKIDFSSFSDGLNKFKANSLPFEVKMYHDDAFEHSSLLASLSKSKPGKRPRGKEQSNKVQCTCPKSKCLKLYCECFSKGKYCEDCNCVDCHNTIQFESIRREAICSTLERNPNAFNSKVNKILNAGEAQVIHSKGCHCNKSACLKNYCECFQSGAVCTDICQCVGCKNLEPKKKLKKSVKK